MLNHAPLNLDEIIGDWDSLSSIELGYRDELIERGLKECGDLLGKQKSKEMYFFYEGSLDGFEECRNLNMLSKYETRIRELYQEEERETACSYLRGDYAETQLLREEMHIYNPNEETDINEVWRIKGVRTQVEFVYNRLMAFKVVCDLSKKQAGKHKI